MRLDVPALRRQDAAALAALNKTCKTCARIGASKVGALPFVNDIAQDMLIVVLTRWLDVADGERDVEPYLIEMARRMGLSYYRRHSREINASPDDGEHDLIGSMADEGPDAEAANLEQEVERQAAEALAALIARMREVRAGRGAAAAPDAPAAVRPSSLPAFVEASATRQEPACAVTAKQRRDRASRPAVRELVAVRKRLGLTQTQMARALGLTSINAIRSLEYGVVLGEPGKLLAGARELEGRMSASFNAALSGAALVCDWARRLGVSVDDPSGLAQHIGVHRTTIYRWRNDITQPPPHLVRLVNAIVEAIEESRQPATAAPAPAPIEVVATDASSATERERRASRPAVQELMAIRRRLGFTQGEMAKALNMPSRFGIRSLESGVVVGEPEKLLEQARRLAGESPAIEPDAGGRALLERWGAELGLNPETQLPELARRINVHRSTAYRWWTNRTSPQAQQIREITQLLDEMARKSAAPRRAARAPATHTRRRAPRAGSTTRKSS